MWFLFKKKEEKIEKNEGTQMIFFLYKSSEFLFLNGRKICVPTELYNQIFFSDFHDLELIYFHSEDLYF